MVELPTYCLGEECLGGNVRIPSNSVQQPAMHFSTTGHKHFMHFGQTYITSVHFFGFPYGRVEHFSQLPMRALWAYVNFMSSWNNDIIGIVRLPHVKRF